MPVLVNTMSDSKLLSHLSTLCQTLHWSTLWNMRNMRSCTQCGVGTEGATCEVLLPSQLMDLCKHQKGVCVSCTEPLALPTDEVIPNYNFLYPRINYATRCTSRVNVSYLLCGICHNLWNATFGDEKEFNKYRQVLVSTSKGVINGISYRPTLTPGIKVYIPPKIKKVKPYRAQWDLQHGCGALVLPGDTDPTIFKVPLSTNSNHLLAVKVTPKVGTEVSETNFLLMPDIFFFLQGVYSRKDFLKWAAAHLVRGVPAADHFKAGIPTLPSPTERVRIIAYGKLYHAIKKEEKLFTEKKKELKQLELAVQQKAQKSGDHEKSLQLREHQLIFSIKRKEGTPNPITEKYLQEMLPYALLKTGILSPAQYTQITKTVWENVVTTLYDPALRGRRPTSRSLIVKPLLVQQNTIEI